MPYMQDPSIVMAPARTLVDIVKNDNSTRNLVAGYQLGSDISDKVRERIARQAISQAYDPRTGTVDNGRVLAALMQYDPATGIRYMQQKRIEEQQQRALSVLMGDKAAGTGPGNGQGTPELVPGIAMDDADRKLIAFGFYQGNPEVAFSKVYDKHARLSQALDTPQEFKLQNARTMYATPRQLYDQGVLPRPSWYTGSPPGGDLGQQQGVGQLPPSQIQTRPQGSGMPAPSQINPPQTSSQQGGSPQGSITKTRSGQNDLGAFQGNPYFSDAVAIAKNYGIDPALFLSLLQTESGFDPKAKSPKGAMGLGQLMPDTAARFGVQDPYHPIQNMTGSAKYLKFLWDRFGGDIDKVLAAYNAGEGNVDKYGGVPPYEETQNYVKRVREGMGPAVQGNAPVVVAQNDTGPLQLGSPAPSELKRQELEVQQPYQVQAEQRQLSDWGRKNQIEQQQKIAEENRRSARGYQEARYAADAKLDADLNTEMRNDAKSATSGLVHIKDMRVLADQGTLDKGSLTAMYGRLGRILYAFGTPESNATVADAIRQEQFGQVAKQLTYQVLGGSLGKQISDSDRKFIEDMVPQLGKTKEATLGILDRLEKAFNRQREKYIAWGKAKQANPNIRESEFNQQWEDSLQKQLDNESKTTQQSNRPAAGSFDIPKSFDSGPPVSQPQRPGYGLTIGGKFWTMDEIESAEKQNPGTADKLLDQYRQETGGK